MRRAGVGLLLLAAACGGSAQNGTPACDIGAEKCACTSGGVCNPGLTCASSLCVKLGVGQEAGLSTSGLDAASSDDASSSGDSPSDVVSEDATVEDGPTQDSTVPADADLDASLGFGDALAVDASGDAGGWRSKVDHACGTPTTLSGTVYDPAGKNPLANVWVFVPNDLATLPAITTGTRSCNTCDSAIGDYVTATITDYKGQFTLSGVPAASQVPVTVQTGKWRRTTLVDINTDCAPNSAPDKTLHLPGSKAQGDMPQIALLTGGCDDMACFLLNMGISTNEFGAPHAGRRVDVYQGNALGGTPGPTLDTSIGTAGNCTTTSCPLWASKTSLEAYDLAVFSCECGEQTSTNESAAAYTNVHDWVEEGGRLLGSHYSYTWFRNNPDAKWAGTATWLGTSVASGTGTYDVVTSFPKAATFEQWLGSVGALTSVGPPPTISLSSVATSVSSVNTATTHQWILDPSSSDTKYLSFTTPVRGGASGGDAGEAGAPPADAGTAPGPQFCGKAVFTDMHSSSNLVSQAANVPSACTASNLTAQQKALEYLFFDLSACVSDDSQPYAPPPPPH